MSPHDATSSPPRHPVSRGWPPDLPAGARAAVDTLRTGIEPWRWIVAVAEVLAPFGGATAAGALVGWSPLSRVALGAVGAGATCRGLGRLVHESAHQTLSPSKEVNRSIGRIAAALVLQRWASYRASHLPHHGSIGNPERDGDHAGMLQDGLYEPRSARAFAWRYLVLPLLGSRVLPYWRFILRERSSPARVVAVMTALACLLASTTWWGGFGAEVRLAFAAWLIGLVYVYPVVGWLAELSEHFPFVGFRADSLSTRHRSCGPVARIFVGLLQERYHLAHHVVMKVPYWRLPEAHRILLASPSYRAQVEASRGGWRAFGFTRQLLGLHGDLERELRAGG